MLLNINPLLGPDLLRILRSMGNVDEIAIVDANYPASSSSSRLVRMDGVDANAVLKAVLSVLPLDTYVDTPIQIMQVVGNSKSTPEAVQDFQKIVAKDTNIETQFGSLERFAFYTRIKSAYAIIATGEQRLYGNILLKKGVIEAL